jgi:hypothetical protein
MLMAPKGREDDVEAVVGSTSLPDDFGGGPSVSGRPLLLPP